MIRLTMTYMITFATAFGESVLGLELLHVLKYAQIADGWLIIPCIDYIRP